MFYHASPHPITEIEPNRLFFVSDNKEYVKNEYGAVKNYPYLYQIELYKTKVKCFDLLKVKHYKIWLKYLLQEYQNYAYRLLNMTIKNGKLAWHVEREVLPILQANNFNCCLFDEAGADMIGDEKNEWGEMITKEYGNVTSLAIIDPKIIKFIKPIYIPNHKFQITKYLHIPTKRICTQDINYTYSTEKGLYQLDPITTDLICMVDMKDCRPLLTVEIDGVEWTEGDIIKGYEYNSIVIWHFNRFVLRNSRGRIEEINKMIIDYHKYKITGSFFDDPKKYSKILWGCTEEEGWEKILKLLNIK